MMIPLQFSFMYEKQNRFVNFVIIASLSKVFYKYRRLSIVLIAMPINSTFAEVMIRVRLKVDGENTLLTS